MSFYNYDDTSSLDSLSTDDDKDSFCSYDNNDKYYNHENLSKTEIIEKIKYLQKMFNLDKIKSDKYCSFMENSFKINCSCCTKVYCCSQCHNFEADHKLDIKYTNIICWECDIEQNITDYCIACEKKLKTKYSCKKCYIFDNNNKYKFHCDKCNNCHIEEREKLMHCEKCKICYLENNKHICINFDNNCPICFEILKNDIVVNLICGHAIHNDCYNLLIKNSYKCPLCFKTIIDMKDNFKKLEEEIENTKEFERSLNLKEIYCNDCEKKSDTIFSYLGLKCHICGSFNTRLE